jgi:hypothetical protein
MSGRNRKRAKYRVGYKNLVLYKHTYLYLYSTTNSKRVLVLS